jgi:hypothetical protein
MSQMTATKRVTTSAYLRHHVIPAAYDLLPPQMASPEATAMLLAIAFQESRCYARCQVKGPARSFYQFELGGVTGVMKHGASARPLVVALQTLAYPNDALTIHEAMAHNDVLATVCARLLLWTLPSPLPAKHDPEAGWQTYIKAWRPGKPHRHSWDLAYHNGWVLAEETRCTS